MSFLWMLRAHTINECFVKFVLFSVHISENWRWHTHAHKPTNQTTEWQSMKTYGNIEMDMEHERNGLYVIAWVTAVAPTTGQQESHTIGTFNAKDLYSLYVRIEQLAKKCASFVWPQTKTHRNTFT